MSNLEKDLRDCLSMISNDWDMQNDFNDKKTNFIYSTKSLKECLHLINFHKVDKDYTLHRWYNYMTSVYCEYLFCEYGAIHEQDKCNHDVDIYINEIPFDVKLTIYPAKLSNRPYNLKTRKGKNQLIQWYYSNQSQQARKQLLNRIYIVCDGNTPYECLKMKSDFNILKKKIKQFMEYSIKNGFNKLSIKDDNKEYILYSDIIYITYE